MLRYKTETRPGLVALYDIRPGNGAGLFLQPRSPHGAHSTMNLRVQSNMHSINATESTIKVTVEQPLSPQNIGCYEMQHCKYDLQVTSNA